MAAKSMDESLQELRNTITGLMALHVDQAKELRLLRDEQELMRRRILHLEERLRLADPLVALTAGAGSRDSPRVFGNTPSAASAFRPVPTSHPTPDIATPTAASKAAARPGSSKSKKRRAIAAVGKALSEGRFASEKPAKRPRQRKSSVTEPRPEEASVPSTSPAMFAASPTPSVTLEAVAEVAVASAWEDEADFSAEEEEDIDIVSDRLETAPSPPVKLERPPVVVKTEKRSSPLPAYLPQPQVQPAQQEKKPRRIKGEEDEDDHALQDILTMLKDETNNDARFEMLDNLLRQAKDDDLATNVHRAMLGGADEILVSWLDELIAGLKVAPTNDAYWKVAVRALYVLNLVEWEQHAEKACTLGIDARVKKLYGLAKVQNHEKLMRTLKKEFWRRFRRLRQHDSTPDSGDSDNHS